MKATDFPQLKDEDVIIEQPVEKQKPVVLPPLSDTDEKLAPEADSALQQAMVLYADLPPPEAEAGDYEELSNHPNPLPRNEKKEMNAAVAREDRLDLHQYTVPDAHASLQNFLNHCLRRRVKLVEIVHGRGEHSKDHKPILRGKVRCWLAQCPQVRAYQTIANGGALVALLVRSKRKS